MIILFLFSYSNLAQHQPLITEHQTAQFTSEWEATVNRGIWTILPRQAADSRISRTHPRNLAKFSAENCGPY